MLRLHASFVGFNPVKETLIVNDEITSASAAFGGMKGVQERTNLLFKKDLETGLLNLNGIKLIDSFSSQKKSSSTDLAVDLPSSFSSASLEQNINTSGNFVSASSVLGVSSKASISSGENVSSVPTNFLSSANGSSSASILSPFSGGNTSVSANSKQGSYYAAFNQRRLANPNDFDLDSRKNNSKNVSVKSNSLKGTSSGSFDSNTLAANSNSLNSLPGSSEDSGGFKNAFPDEYNYQNSNESGSFASSENSRNSINENHATSNGTSHSTNTGGNSSVASNGNNNSSASTSSASSATPGIPTLKSDGCYSAKNDFYSKLGNTGSYTEEKEVTDKDGKVRKQYCIKPGADHLQGYEAPLENLKDSCPSEISTVFYTPEVDGLCVWVDDPPSSSSGSKGVDHNLGDIFDSKTHESGNVPKGWGH